MADKRRIFGGVTNDQSIEKRMHEWIEIWMELGKQWNGKVVFGHDG